MNSVIFRAKTSDDQAVCVWADGDLTSSMGHAFRGARVTRDLPRSLLIAKEALSYTRAEMFALIKAANLLGKEGAAIVPETLRAEAAKILRKRKIKGL